MYTKLPAKWSLPQELRQRFGSKGAGKQRAMFKDGHLLIILHKAPFADEAKRHAIIFWRDPKKTWQNSESNRGFNYLTQHIEEYSQREMKLSKLYDKSSSPEDYFEILEELSPFVRAADNLAKAMQQARELAHDDFTLIGLRDHAQEIARETEILYTDSRHGLDYQIAKRAEEQAKYSQENIKSTDRLNTLVAIFLPITAFSGIFGMNLNMGLQNSSPIWFPVVMIASIVLGFAVKSWITPKLDEE